MQQSSLTQYWGFQKELIPTWSSLDWWKDNLRQILFAYFRIPTLEFYMSTLKSSSESMYLQKSGNW